MDDVAFLGNQLQSLPKEIGNLVNMRFLTVASNNLTSLPEEMNKLEKLELIYLANNKFQDIFTVIQKLINPLNQVKRLDLEVNITHPII